MKQNKKNLGTLTRDCIIIFFFAAVFFAGSYIGVGKLQEWETWEQARGTIVEVEHEKFYNEQEEKYKVREWGTVEFTKSDGEVCQEDFEWVNEEVSATEGDMKDVIYDPESDDWQFGELPEKGEYTIMYVMRYVALAVAIGVILIWLRGYFKSKQME